MDVFEINFASFISNNILAEWSTAVSIVVAVVSASFVALLLLTNLFADSEASNGRKIILEAATSAITSYVLQFFNIILEMIRKLSELPTTLILIWNTLLSNTYLLVLILILWLVSYSIYQYDTFILMSLDSFYRCNVTPFFNNFVLSVLHVITLIWGAIVPIYNFFFVLIRQLLIGSFAIASKCTLTTFTYFDYVIGWTEVFIEFLTGLLKFSGATDGFTAENNFFVNKFEIASIVRKIRELHHWVPHIFTCICEQVNLFWEILFYPLQDTNVDYIIEYTTNAVICFIQTLIQIVPPFLKYPNFSRFFLYLEAALFSSADLVDNWFFFTFNKVLDVIGSNILIEPPKPFVFKIGSHFSASFLGVVETATNVTIHTLLPVDPDIPFSNYGAVWSLEKSFFHINIFISFSSYIVHWFSRNIIELLESGIYLERCAKVTDKPVCLNAFNGKCSVECMANGKIRILNMYQDCSGTAFNSNLKDTGVKDVKTGQPIYEEIGGDVDLFTTLSCGIESLNKGTVNIFVVAYNLFLTFWWEILPTIFEGGTPEKNNRFYPVIRDHVGPMFSRDKIPRCFVDTMKVNSLKPIDLYCARPNLNEHVLFYFDRAAEFFWGIFEPTSFGKVGLYLISKPITEFIRVFLRIMSSLDILFEKDIRYIEQKMISGYLDVEYPSSCENLNPALFDTTRTEDDVSNTLSQEEIDSQASMGLLNNNNLYFGLSYRIPTVAQPEEEIPMPVSFSKQSTEVGDDAFLVDGIETKFTDGKSQEVKVDITTVNNEQVSITSTGAYDPFLGESYKDAYTNIEVENWCNINLFEWFFIYTSRATEGAVRILSIFENQQLPNSDEVDPCINSFKTNIKVDKKFAPNINFFSVGGFGNLDNVFGYLKYLKIGATVAMCELDVPRSTFCTFGDILGKGVGLLRNLVRTQTRNFLNIVSGKSANLDLSHDICNFQKLEYAISNFAGSLVPVQGDQREGVNLILYSIIDIFGSYLIMIQHLVSTLVAPTPEGLADVSLAAKLLNGENIDINNMLDTTLTFAINLVYRTLMQFIDGLWLFTNKDSTLFGLKQTLNSLLVVVQDIKMLLLRIIRVGIMFLHLFISNNLSKDLEAIQDELLGTNGLVVDFFRVLSKVLLRIVGIILDNLGDFGIVVRKIILGICDAAEDLNKILSAQNSKFPTLDCSSFNTGDELGLNKVRDTSKQEEQYQQYQEDKEKYGEGGAGYKLTSQTRSNMVEDGINLFGEVTGTSEEIDEAKDWFNNLVKRRRLLEHDNNTLNSNKTKSETYKSNFKNNTNVRPFNLAARIAKKYTWKGESECDAIIKAYSKETKLEHLSPLEKVTILKCYEYRVLGEQIRKIIPIFPEDMFYNWWRKYKFGFDITRLLILYTKSFFNGESRSSLKHKLVSNGFNPNDVFEFVKNVQRGFSNIKIYELHQNVMEELKTEESNNNSVAKLYVDSTKLIANVYNWMKIKNRTSTTFNRMNISEFLNFSDFASNINIPSAHEIFSNHSLKQLKQVSRLTTSNTTVAMKTLFGQIYTDLKCNPTSPLCLNCALFDNFVFAAFDSANVSLNYYTKSYTTKVTPEFKQYWLNVTEYNIRYIRGSSMTSSTIFGSYETTYYYSDIYPSYRNFDLIAYIIGLWQGTRSWGEIPTNIEYFFSGNYTGKIPAGTALMFGPIDAQYIIEWPFQQECTDTEFLYDSKVNRVGYGLISVVGLYSSYFIITRLIVGPPPEPLNILVSASLPIMSFILYLTVVYQYNPLCLPSMNVWLVYDFLNYVEDFLFLDCFCSYFPFLFKGSCSQAVCDTCQIADFTNSSYYSCQDDGLVTGFNELSFAWHFIFVLRWLFADTFIFFEGLNIWPLTYFYEIDGVRLLLQDANQNIPVSGIEETCFFLHIGVPISILLVLYISFLCLLPFVDFVVFYSKQVILISLYLIMAIHQLGKTLLNEGFNTD